VTVGNSVLDKLQPIVAVRSLASSRAGAGKPGHHEFGLG
jgi:hypothetical protein